jgi:hypothetical protein
MACEAGTRIRNSVIDLNAIRAKAFETLVFDGRQTRTLAAAGGVLGSADFAKRSAYEAGSNAPPAATQDCRIDIPDHKTGENNWNLTPIN